MSNFLMFKVKPNINLGTTVARIAWTFTSDDPKMIGRDVSIYI